MDDNKCIICNGNLIKFFEEFAMYSHEVLFGQCKNCGSYGYRKNEKQRIKDLIKSDSKNKDILIKRAKNKVNDTASLKTTIIELD